jgi:heme A synthase
MGCGDNWPKCYGYWFPPFSRPELVVEVSHRYLASILTLTVLSLATVAFLKRRDEGVSGEGGPLRSSFAAVGAVFAAALLGGLTVKMGNVWWATVAHWLVAMTLLATLAATAIRAGTLGGSGALQRKASGRAAGVAAAGLAILAVALGGLTAKVPGANAACQSLPPFCGQNAFVDAFAVRVQYIHRIAAMLLLLHLLGVMSGMWRRRATEPPAVLRAAFTAGLLVVAQFVIASLMIVHKLPAALRSLHEATGVGIWLSCFVFAYLARRSSSAPLATLPDATPSSHGGARIPDTGRTQRGVPSGSIGFGAERLVGDASLAYSAEVVTEPAQPAAPVVPVAIEPPKPPAPTMAVIVARGADLL